MVAIPGAFLPGDVGMPEAADACRNGPVFPRTIGAGLWNLKNGAEQGNRAPSAMRQAGGTDLFSAKLSLVGMEGYTGSCLGQGGYFWAFT